MAFLLFKEKAFQTLYFAVFIAKCYGFYIGIGFNINDKEKDIRFD